MRGGGVTPSPTPTRSNEITALSVDGTDILAEGSSVNTSSRTPTIHVKIQRVSTDVDLKIGFFHPNETMSYSDFSFPEGELDYEGDIHPDGNLLTGSHVVAMFVGDSIMAAQTCGTIVVS